MTGAGVTELGTGHCDDGALTGRDTDIVTALQLNGFPFPDQNFKQVSNFSLFCAE